MENQVRSFPDPQGAFCWVEIEGSSQPSSFMKHHPSGCLTKEPGQISGEVAFWKRALDITVILAATPLLIPLLACIAAAIRVRAGGPVLFRQERVGYRGRGFICLKFRTMTAGADTNSHQEHLSRLINRDLPMAKMDAQGDPRLIPMGALLRSTGLDELPQLWNVLRGEMSLVGPRPCTYYEHDHYLPWQKERFDTLPGLTGLWQVTGKNKTTFVEMMRLDIDYVRHKTPWLDLQILLKTVPVLYLQVRETRKTKTRLASR